MNKRNHSQYSQSFPQPSVSVKPSLLPVAVPLTKIIPIQKIIRLSNIELAAKVEQALDDNPFLERVSSEGTVTQPRERNLEGPLTVGLPSHSQGHSQGSSIDRDQNVLEAVNAAPELSLTGDLLEQLDWLEISPDDREIAEMVISLVGEWGYIDPLEAERVREDFGANTDQFRRVWKLLKDHLEPPGVTCEGVEDSLVTQLFRRGYDEADIAVRVIREAFPLLSKKKYVTIAKHLGVPTSKVKAAAKVIHSLDPYPLRNRTQDQYDNTMIVPDVVVRHQEGRLDVVVNRDTVPQIRLLKDIVKDSAGRMGHNRRNRSSDQTSPNLNRDVVAKEAEDFLKEKKVEAENLVQAIGYRESNLKRVVDYLVERQRNFFMEGFSRLQPCRMVDLAEELKIDKGSLSRLVNNKYVSTDWGTFRLREMFSLPVEVNGKKVSPKVIQEKIRALIKEFSEIKLTDKKIAMMLKKLGYPIARRTVNKYRRLVEQQDR